jgi:hypothetical protein
MGRFHQAFNAGRNAVMERSSAAGTPPYDPAGQERDQGRLRGMGKWRFILARGIIGMGGPMFVLGLVSLLLRSFHESTLHNLLGHWVVDLCVTLSVSAFFGFVIGILAWRRVTSDVWPGAKPDPESATTTLGPLSLR